MKRILFMTLSLPIIMMGQSKGKSEFTVLQWNARQGGTIVPGGCNTVVNEIIRLQPDFVAFSEVRNYYNTRFSDRTVASFREKGLDYYSFYTYDTGLLNKHPTTDPLTVFPENGDHGSIYKLTSSVNGHKVAVYTAHSDYLDCAYYNVCGCDGPGRRETSIPTTVEEVLKVDVVSQHDDTIKMFTAEAKKDIVNGYSVIIDGDFNEPSHLDWIEESKNLYDHNGLVIPWMVTTLLEKGGFIDTCRHIYPNLLTHPGLTHPADNPLKEPGRLTWIPKADERDHIDFILHQGKDIEAKKAVVSGPKSSVVCNQRVQETSGDKFLLPLDVWSTDHKRLLVALKMK